MTIKRSINWVLLVCICVTLAFGFLQVQTFAASTVITDNKLDVELTEDDGFTYFKLLDLSAASKDVPLLDMEVNPCNVGTADARNIRIRLTDVYDEENYITICLNNINADWAKGHIYVTAGGAKQPQVGIENAGNPDSMKAYVNNPDGYGAAVDFSMVGMPKTGEDTHLTLYFDYAEKAIYADRETYTHEKQLIVDLDETSYFGGNLWEGFTTGQVRMSIYATNYQADSCNILISTINGESGFQNADDTESPIVWINTGYESGQLPTALVGKPYCIFAAEAVDGLDGKIEPAASVYYGYGSETSVKIPVTDGKFTPDQAGAYVIEYTATDRAGNVGKQYVSINAVQGDGLQVALQDVVTQTENGASVQVISGISYTDASGYVSYTLKAKNAETGDEVAIDPKTHSFTPMSEGEWEVTVTVQDYVSTVVKTFTVNANRTSQPQVYDTVALPDYFVLGATYHLPTLSGYDFSSGKAVLTPMDIYVTETGSTETCVANGQYVPANAGTVTVTYRLTVDGKTCEKSYTAVVVNVKTVLNTVSLGKYFVDPAGNATSSAGSSKITYTVSKDTRLNFVNYVQVKQLSFSFQAGSKNAYNKVSVYLTDILSGKQVKLTFSRTGSGTAFSVNDGAIFNLSTAFTGAFTLAFYSDTGIVVPETGTQINVNNFLDGSEFTGFTDGIAKFTVEISQVSGSSQFVITNLNGQKMSNATKDSVAPQLIANALSGNRDQGEKLYLKGAFVYDVLDPVATVTLKVTDPDGTAVTDESGIVLNGTQDATQDTVFTMDKLGTYTIFYTVTDGKKNTGRYIYTVTAVDGQGPTITLLDHTETVKPGETVKIADVAVTDNITANCTVATYVFDSEGVYMPVTDGTFTASKCGVYTVKYMAWDGDGNYSFASYRISAQEAEAHYLSQSLSLGSDLVVHLWGNVPEAYANSISGKLTYDDDIHEFEVGELSAEENGLYHMQAEMAVAQMTENIQLVLKHKIIGEVIHKSYSIRDYAVTLIEGDYSQDTKELCLELLNFGAMAQQYFQYNTGNLANNGYLITPAHTVPSEVPEVSKTGSVSGIRFYGTSVRFLSQTAVCFYFVADGGVDGYTFTIDGVACEPIQKDGMYYIETPGINPQNMSKEITASVTDGTDTLSVGYAPIWYFIRTYNKSDDTTAKNLMAAAYSYYQEAQTYAGENAAPGDNRQPELPTGQGTYIYLDVLVTTLGNSNDPVDICFYPHDFEGSVNDWTDKITVKAGTTTTVKLDAEKYMVDGLIPEGLGIAVFGGPTWDAVLSDGVTPDRHTLTISKARLKGEFNGWIDLRTAAVTSGTNDTGFTDANGNGKASIVGESIVIKDGFRFDGHKITLGRVEIVEPTYISMDIELTTLSNSANPVDICFYPHGFDGDIFSEHTDKVSVTAGTKTTVKLGWDNYLVDGEFPGIGIAVFGGPEWNTELADGGYDRHSFTVSNVRLEGPENRTVDMRNAAVDTGFANANKGGTAAVVDGTVTVTDGYRYDGHMITFNEVDTYLKLDMLITTLGNSAAPIEVRFYADSYEGSVHNGYTDLVTVTAGKQETVRLDLSKYLVDGKLTGIGVAVFGGPEWNTTLADGTPDKHSFTISNVCLEGKEERTIDLSSAAVTTGLNGSNVGGTAAVLDGTISVVNGIRYDGHKIVFVGETEPEGTEPEVTEPDVTEPEVTEPEVTEPEMTEPEMTEPDTYISLDMLITTLGNSTSPIEVRFYPYNYEGSVHNSYTDLVTVTAGELTTIQLDLDNYLVDGELTGIGFAIFGGPEWNDAAGDRHTVAISNVKLEGGQSKLYDLSRSVWTSGNSGTGYTDANGWGTATIGSSVVITGGIRYDGHKLSLVENTNTYICMDLLITTLSNSANPIEVRFYADSYEDSVHNGYTDLVTVTAGTVTTVRLKADDYLVDGEFPGIGVAIFGGPEWNTALAEGGYDRHNVMISNMRLEGAREQVIDLNTATVTTGLTGSNVGGTIAVVDGGIVISDGYRYDGHKISF